MVSYTVQSYKNGNYISSLFSNGHEDTFQAKRIEDAYVWNNIEAARKIAIETGCCTLVKLNV